MNIYSLGVFSKAAKPKKAKTPTKTAAKKAAKQRPRNRLQQRNQPLNLQRTLI
jgi:hypothetical protein